MIDLQTAKKYVQKSFLPDIETEYGEDGGRCLRVIVDFLNKLFQEVEPSEFSKTVKIFKTLNDFEKDLGTSERVSSLSEIKRFRSIDITIQIFNESRFIVWAKNVDPRKELVDDSVVYEYHNWNEYFYAKHKKLDVEKIDYEFPSMFAVPTFTVLDRALNTYKVEYARRAKCYHLQKCMDVNRIFFFAAPEDSMQISLHSYLDCTLRFNDSNVKVTREVNTGLSYPVDIKVVWTNANKSALIEIKWIGVSYRQTDWKRTAYYMGPSGDKRVNEGNKQLAEYLERNKDSDYNPSTIGYYLVFDGRRKNIKKGANAIRKKDGFFYETFELILDNAYHTTRNDFREPLRIFIEPICLD